MDDKMILNLYRMRQTAALSETEAKYGRLCFAVHGDGRRPPFSIDRTAADKGASHSEPQSYLDYNCLIARFRCSRAIGINPHPAG